MNRTRHMNRPPLKSMLGMSLVEVLAAMLIGLIGMTIIMQVFSVSEERKRTTTGTSDAQITGNIATFTLERELRLAGFGMVSADSNMLGCNTVAYDSKRSDPDFDFTMAPVAIAEGAGGTPDEITITYGNSAQIVDGSGFAAGGASAADFKLKNAAGFSLGDIVVAYEPAGGVKCAMAEVTGFDVSATNDVQHVAGASYTYQSAAGNNITVAATRNKPGGVDVGGAFTADARLFSLGRTPTVVTYVVENDRLRTKTLVPYNAAQDSDGDDLSDADVADGVVSLKAQYGKDTNADGIVDVWNTTAPASAADWLQVRAIRFGLLVRSGQYEKSGVTDSGAGTAPAPSWYGGAFTMANPADGTDWHKYRYRVYQTVVPLRNMIWSTD